ncbi:TMEM175 family protein [Streptomyces albidoflavus]
MSSVPEDPSAFVAPSREQLPAASAMAVGPPARLLALSDGIYAIAMTLLVLDLSLPEGLDSAEFHRELHAMIPQFLAYGLSFTLLVGFWQDQRRIHLLVRQADEGFIRLTALGLGAVALVPFPTSMLSDYTDEPVAVALYSAVIAAIDLIHLAQFTLLCRRPRLRTRAVPRRLLWGFSAELGSTILVFGTAAVIALFDPTAAMYSWLALIPLKVAVGRASRGRPVRPADGD